MIDLESRVASRKLELISELIEHKKNSSRVRAASEIERITAHLSDLAAIVKETVIDGWANVDASARVRFDQWLAR